MHAHESQRRLRSSRSKHASRWRERRCFMHRCRGRHTAPLTPQTQVQPPALVHTPTPRQCPYLHAHISQDLAKPRGRNRPGAETGRTWPLRNPPKHEVHYREVLDDPCNILAFIMLHDSVQRLAVRPTRGAGVARGMSRLELVTRGCEGDKPRAFSLLGMLNTKYLSNLCFPVRTLWHPAVLG